MRRGQGGREEKEGTALEGEWIRGEDRGEETRRTGGEKRREERSSET